MILLLGAGGFAKEIAEWGGTDLITFYSDDPTSKSIFGRPITSSMKNFKEFFPAIGDPIDRMKMVAAALCEGLICETHIIRPDATVADHDVDIGIGSIICPGVRISPSVRIGQYCIINLNVTVGHDTVICDYVTISPGANISGKCTIGRGAYIGTGSCIREGIVIGAGAVIGMGAVVVKDVPAGETWVGNPARKLK